MFVSVQLVVSLKTKYCVHYCPIGRTQTDGVLGKKCCARLELRGKKNKRLGKMIQ